MISIVLGMREGELGTLEKPSMYDKNLPKTKIKKLHKRVKKQKALCFGTDLECRVTILSLENNGETEIEVFGAWEQYCVKDTIQYALAAGLSVRVPKGFTFKYSDQFTTKKDLNEILSLPKSSGLSYLTFDYSEDKKFMYFKPVK